MSVVTRFAPSPTGFLHIGGARTALFNYLFAAHHGGRYLLRIEDTDKKRSTSEAIEAIHDGLNWLGLGGNEDVILQSERVERHRAVAEEMLAAGTAYKCFLTDAFSLMGFWSIPQLLHILLEEKLIAHCSTVTLKQ